MHVDLISGLLQVSDVQERMDKPVLIDNSKMETKMMQFQGEMKLLLMVSPGREEWVRDLSVLVNK